MKKRLLFAALFSAALVSCTKDQVVEVQQDEIKFRVATENATKAGAVATTTNSITAFKVWAYTESSQLYINGEEYTRTLGNSEWKNYDTKHFWPEEDLNFYSISPTTIGGTINITSSNKTIDDYIASGEEDLLYSVKLDQSKSDPTVELNFRHALSQIVFKAINNNTSKLGVEISGVTVKNIYSKNSKLTLPTVNTDNNLISDSETTTETDGKWGVWKNDGYFLPIDYQAAITSAITLSADKKDLTDIDVNSCHKGLLLLPQTLTPWNTEDDPANSEGGSYFEISCKVWNITGDATQDATPVYLWGTKDTYKTIAIPTNTITWKQGMKYIYTFIFGDGAGYEPPVDGDTEVTPVLVPIKLSVTVDEFQSYTEQEVSMEPVAVP